MIHLLPTFRSHGKELFYLAADQKLMAVAVNGEGTFKASAPKFLLQTREIMSRCRSAVTADAQRFLVNTPLEEANTSPITVVLNGRTRQKVRVQELRTIRAGILEARKVNSC
jgi:hypothetical protein